MSTNIKIYDKTAITNDYAFLCGRLATPIIDNVDNHIQLDFSHKIIQDTFEEIISNYKSKIKQFFTYNITPGKQFKKTTYTIYKSEPYHRIRPQILEGFSKSIVEKNTGTLLKNHIKVYLYNDIYNLQTNLKKYFYPFSIEVEEKPLLTNTNYFYLIVKIFFS